MLFYCTLSYLVLRFSVYFESRVLQNYLKTYAQNAGNRVSEVSDFKIFRGAKKRGQVFTRVGLLVDIYCILWLGGQNRKMT